MPPLLQPRQQQQQQRLMLPQLLLLRLRVPLELIFWRRA